jgi:four helix bundle protein
MDDMKKENPLREKSYLFALHIITLYMFLKKMTEFELGKQILRSGTSIGANIEEANFAQSKKDFASKLSISLKEASETRYWLRLLGDSHIVELAKIGPLMERNEELIRLLVASIKTAKLATAPSP